MRSSKSRTIESRGASRSPSKPSHSPKLNSEKNLFLRANCGKIITKNSLNKLPSANPMSPKGSPKHYASYVQLKPPAIKTLKPSQSQSRLKKIGKEPIIEKPRILKRKNESLAELQTKLRTIENQISSLKSNISSTDEHTQRMKKSRTKSKQSKKSSVNTSHKKRASEPVERNSIEKQPSHSKIKHKTMVQSPSKGLNSYVTKWNPTPLTSTSKIQPEQEATPDLPSKYYIKHTSLTMKQHLLSSLNIFNFLSKVRKPEDHQIEPIRVKLPSHPKHKKTLVFDLDETLIHCVDMGKPSDIRLPITFMSGEIVQAGINVRSYARQILANLSKKFQIVVFTASHSCYANVVIDWLDPKKEIIHHRYFRQNCYKTDEGIYIKDLRVFSNRSLDNMVLVDNAPYSYFFQLQNGIPILPFYNSKDDIQLKALQKFLLEEVYPASNVREVLKKHFKLHLYRQFADTEKLMQGLYMQ